MSFSDVTLEKFVHRYDNFSTMLEKMIRIKTVEFANISPNIEN